MGLIDKLAELAVDRAASSRTKAADERRQFRQALLTDLRQYSVLVEQVRQRFLAVHDALEAAQPLKGESGDRDLAIALDDHLPSEDLVLPEGVRLALTHYSERLDASAGVDALERTRLALRQLETLDEAWASLRPRLDETLEAEAVAYLRTYRHEFRRLGQRAIWVVERAGPPHGLDTELVKMYVEAVLIAADRWNSHIVGTIGELRGGRAV